MTHSHPAPSSIRDDSICESSLNPNKSSGDIGELKPCPFCGPGNSIVECYQDDYGGWRVGCGRCGSHSGFRPKSDPDARAKVIANWNKRPAEFAAEIERLRRGYHAILDGLLTGSVGGEDVVWFDPITTLYDFCDEIINGNEPRPLGEIKSLLERALTAESALAAAYALLERYLKETPLGNQPHMIAGEVEEFLATRASAIRAAVSKKTAESGHSPSTHNSESE